MGKTKDKRLVAVNCTIREEDLNLANELGETEVKGRPVVNTSHGFREVFRLVRRLGDAILLIQTIRDLLAPENSKAKKIITPSQDKLTRDEKIELALSLIDNFIGVAKIDS